MREGLDSLNHIKSLGDFQNVANHFERIAGVEKDEWLPGYYAAYCYVVLSFKEQDQGMKEKLLSKSENLINQILEIKPDESEIYALQGMLFQSFIMADPQNNAPTYSAKANRSFDKSIELNSDNPRPYYLKGMNLMYTPEAYGGGMKTACPLMAKADELFSKFEKENDLMPDWGKEYNAQLLEKCGEDYSVKK
jgi:tetratricopeptide (TPR) repeat protein